MSRRLILLILKNSDKYSHIKNYKKIYKLVPDDANDYLIINGEFSLSDEIIKYFYDNYLQSNAKIMSPIITKNEKLIYCGGIINNNKIMYFNDEHISLKDIKNNKNCFKFTKKTMIPFHSLFIINGKYLSKINDIVKVSLEIKNVSVDQFTYIDMINDDIILDENNEMCVSGVSFFYENECISEILKFYLKNPLTSLKFVDYKFLDINDSPYCLIIDNFLPKTDKNCGAIYTFNMIKALIELSYNVHYVTLVSDKNNTDKYVETLQKMGVYVYNGKNETIEDVLKNNYNLYDYAIVNRLNCMENSFGLIKKYSHKTKIIYNTHDLSFLRIPINDKNYMITKNKEIDFMMNSDLVNIVSLTEYDMLKKEYPLIKSYYYPISYPSVSNNDKMISERNNIYFIGSSHTPNIEAMNFFLLYVWDNIIKMNPELKLYIIGKCTINLSNRFKDKDNVIFMGEINDIQLDLFLKKIRICIVPLLSGAGVKGKILQSAQYGIPCITTDVGNEGTNFIKNEDIIVFDNLSKKTAYNFAELIVNSYNDVELLEKIGKNANNVARKYYSCDNCVLYCKGMFMEIDKYLDNFLVRTEIKTEKKKVCVLVNCYSNYGVFKNVVRDMEMMDVNLTFEFYLIGNNNEEIVDISIHHKNCYFLMGDNSSYEFSGFQRLLNMLIKRGKIEEFSAFIFMTDKLLNFPQVSLLKNKLNFIENSIENNETCGCMDSWGKQYMVDDFFVEKWIRTNFLVTSAENMKKINYSILSYTLEDIFNKDGTFKIQISTELVKNLYKWMSNPRYKNLNDEQIKKKICSILNEYKLYYRLKNVSETKFWN